MTKLSKITKVNPREVWAHEAQDFTKWLAAEENISLLSDELQIQFENVRVESAAGRYFVDIVADAADNGGKVIIENQLETTNHRHLGQLITYASAFDAKFILWVVTDFNEEHKQAIDWLNRNISENTNFFLVQVEVYRIDDSRPAPKFSVISEPNNWGRVMKSSVSGSEVSETKLLQHEFWEQLIGVGRKNSELSFGSKARPQHWYNLSFGTSRAHIVLTTNTQKGLIGCEIYIRNDKPLFDALEAHKQEIESEIGLKLNWLRRDEATACRILANTQIDVTNRNNWQQANDWLIQSADSFARVFSKRISLR